MQSTVPPGGPPDPSETTWSQDILDAASPQSADASVADDSATPLRHTRACVRCQHRKIKCTRVFPCPQCLRAKVDCIPGVPTRSQRPRRLNSSLRDRLARCEELLHQYINTGQAAPQGINTPSPGVPQGYINSPASNWASQDCQLMEDDGEVAFMDDHLLSLIREEIRNVNDLMNNHETNREPILPNPDNGPSLLKLFISQDSPSVDIKDSWPAPTHAFRLWLIFLDRVHPLTKIIHSPSLQVYVVKSLNGPEDLPTDMIVLLLTVFYVATLSLSARECEDILGEPQSEVLARLSAVIHQGIQQLKTLESKNLAVLQTLVLFLVSYLGRPKSHTAWILNGLVIRMAQKMGLHRDGELLGLSPFETEMRRRIWWQILALDIKFALLSGLGHSLLPHYWDSKEPRNLNDADLFPSATQPFADRDGPTEMIFCLIQCKVTKFLAATPGMEPVRMMDELNSTRTSSSADAQGDGQMSYYLTNFDALERDLQALLDKRCDPAAGQIHEVSLGFASTLLNQKRELINGLRQQEEAGGEEKSPESNAFKSAVALTTQATAFHRYSQTTGFVWYARQNIQLEILLYIAVQLNQHSQGPTVERAWQQMALVYGFYDALFDLTDRTASRLAHLMLGAWATRLDMLTRQGWSPTAPDFIQRLLGDSSYQDITQVPAPELQYGASQQAVSLEPSAEVTSGRNESGTYESTETFANMDINLEEEAGREFLGTIAASQSDSQGGLAFMGYGTGPWLEW